MIPKLRFPGFSGEWEAMKLGDVTELFSRRNKEKRVEPIYSVTNSKGFVLQTEHFSKSVAGDDLAAYKIVSKGDFAYNPARINVGSIARLVEDEAIISSLYVCFRVKANTDGAFLDQFLRKDSTVYYYGVFGEGGVRIYLWYPLFSLINIGLPSIEEQEKIAGFLKKVDERITVMDKKIELLQQYKKGVMQKIFNQRLRFKDENGNNYPDWQIKKAGEIFSNISNRNHNGDLPVLSITQDEGVVLRDSLDRKIDQSDAGVQNYKIIEPNDFVISLRSFQGGLEMSTILGISSPAYTVLRGSSSVLPELYKHYFKREEFISQLNSTVIGIRDGKQISYGPFSTLLIPVPVIEEQQKIADFLTSLDDKINLEKTKLEQAKLFKKSLLQRMFV